MLQKLTSFCLVFCLLAMLPQVHAAPKAATSNSAGQPGQKGPRKYLANIIFAGLAGAILGLSTLSFYGRPQDRLSNIAVGFAIGVIGGTMYTTYKAASEPREFYSLRDPMPEAWRVGDMRPDRHAQGYSTGVKFSF